MRLSGTHVSVYSTVIKVLALQSLYSNCKALKLSCDSDNVLEVTEGSSNNSVTCIGLNQTNTVEWLIDSVNFGSCSAPTNGQDTCTVKAQTTVFALSRKEITESVMMINATSPSNNGVIENRTMYCQVYPQASNICTMDLILPAEGSCLAKFIRRDSVSWGVSTDCNITIVYSSLGRYKCEIYSVLSNTETNIFTNNSPALSSAGGKYKSFSCTFTGNMPPDEGLYSYKAIITPGRKIITATYIDSLEIIRPTKSVVRCSPSPDVPENTTVTCTCNTNNIGKPGGRLKWYRGNNQIGTGEYGDSTLVMSQTLYRSDNGVTQFRCDVDWATVLNGDSFTISVGCTSESETSSAGFVQGVGVGVGAIVAVIAILALFTVFCLWRKKQKLTCIDKTVESHESPLTPLTSLNKDVSEIPMDTALAKTPGLYDPLRQSEIGRVSQYSEQSQYESISESSKPKESEGKSQGTPVAHVYHNMTVF